MVSDPTPQVEVVDGDSYLEARYLGSYSLPQYKVQMEISVRACTERKRDLLLVDITSLAGYHPTVMERHEIGILGAQLSRSLSKVAVLGTPEQIRDSFAATVARNRGLAIQAFVDRAEALRWLLEG